MDHHAPRAVGARSNQRISCGLTQMNADQKYQLDIHEVFELHLLTMIFPIRVYPRESAADIFSVVSRSALAPFVPVSFSNPRNPARRQPDRPAPS